MRHLLLLALLVPAGLAQEPPSTYLARFEAAYTATREGRHADALQAFASCLELAPENATVAYHTACVHALAGESDEALGWLARAVVWGFGDGDVMEWEPDLAGLRELDGFADVVDRARARPVRDTGARAEIEWYFPLAFPVLSPDGERMLCGRGRGGSLWDVATGELIALLPDRDRGFNHVRFDPSGAYIVALDYDRKITIWEGNTGAFLRELEEEGGWAGRLQFSADGTRFVSYGMTQQDFVRVWSFPAGELQHTLRQARACALSPDGSRVLLSTGRGGSWQLWDADSGERIASAAGLGMEMHRVEFSRDGARALVVTGAGQRIVIDGRSGEVLRVVEPGVERGPHVVGFDPEIAALVLAGADGAIRWEDPVLGDVLREIETGLEDVWGITLSPDGHFFMASPFWDLRVWDQRTAEVVFERADRDAPSDGAFQEATGELTYKDEMGRVVIHDLERDVVRARIGPGVPYGGRIEPLVGGVVAVPRVGGSIALVDLETASVKGSLADHPRRPTLASAADGERLVSWSQVTRVWEPAGGDRAGEFPGSFRALSNDGRVLVGDEQGLRLHDLARGVPLELEVPGGTNPLHWRPFAWSPDGLWIAAAHGKDVHVWGTRTGSSVQVFTHPERVYDVAFGPQGDHVVTAADDIHARVWNVATGELIVRLTQHDDFGMRHVNTARYTPDGTSIVTTMGDAASVEVWDAATFERRWKHEFSGGNASTYEAWITPAGRRLYGSGMVAGFSRVFDLATGEVLFDLAERDVMGLRATPDDRWILADDSGAMVAFDGETFAERYTRVDYDAAGDLVHLPSFWFRATPAAARAARIQSHGETHPLDGFAAALFDPRRVLAGAAGIEVRRARVPVAPRVVAATPPGRNVRVDGDTALLTLTATDAGGLIGFQLERDGVLLPIESPGKRVAKDADRSELEWTVKRAGAEETTLRICAIGKSGVLSRPHIVTIHFGD